MRTRVAVVLVAASLQFVAGMPHGRLTEFTVSESPLARDLLAEPFRLEPDGTVHVPQGQGEAAAQREDIRRALDRSCGSVTSYGPYGTPASRDRAQSS